MTITLFMTLFTIGSAISGLLTEALKKAVDISSNLTAEELMLLNCGVGEDS